MARHARTLARARSHKDTFPGTFHAHVYMPTPSRIWPSFDRHAVKGGHMCGRGRTTGSADGGIRTQRLFRLHVGTSWRLRRFGPENCQQEHMKKFHEADTGNTGELTVTQFAKVGALAVSRSLALSWQVPRLSFHRLVHCLPCPPSNSCRLGHLAIVYGA